MATKVKLRANESDKLILFAETEPGKFGTAITTDDNTTCECTANQMNVVAVSTEAGYRCNRWQMYVPTSGYTQVDITHIIFKGLLSAYPTSYPRSSTSETYGSKVRIIDEHGTHIGTPSGDVYVGTGYAAAVKHTSTESGWVFQGWKVTVSGPYAYYGEILSAGGTKIGYETTFDASYSEQYAIVCKAPTGSLNVIIIEALYREDVPIVKTVTLEPNGGTVSPIAIQCTTGETYGVLPIPTRSGWRFLGWFDAQTGGNQIDGETQFTDTSPTTLYAHWEEVPVGTFVLTFDDAGGTGGPGSVEVSEGSSYTIPSTPPTRESYTFEHWLSGTDKYNPGDTITPTEDMTFVAVWSGGPYSPRPDSQKDFMVYSSGSNSLAYSLRTGAIVYAV